MKISLRERNFDTILPKLPDDGAINIGLNLSSALWIFHPG